MSMIPESGAPPPATTQEAAAAFADLGRTGRTAWWRFALGLVLACLLGPALLFVLITLAGLVAPPVLADWLTDMLYAIAESTDPLVQATLALLLLASILPSTLLVVRWLHRRPVRSVLTAHAAFDWPGFFLSLGAALGLSAGLVLIGWAVAPELIVFDLDVTAFLPALAVVLLLGPLQTLAEEVLFRGYVLQAVGRATARRWLRIVVPAAIFLLVHVSNREIAEGGLWAVVEFALISLYLSVLALRGNGVEQAWGFHLGNNIVALLVLNVPESSVPMPSLFYLSEPRPALGAAAAALICLLHAAALRRRRIVPGSLPQ